LKKLTWYSPVINKTYHEMAEHYGSAVIPTGVRKPREKANVERAVGILSTWIIVALRNRQFFSLGELNEAMRHKLADFNRKPRTEGSFQKKPGNRENGRNKPEGASRRLLEIVRDDPGFLRRFQAEGY
jgi:transposase